VPVDAAGRAKLPPHSAEELKEARAVYIQALHEGLESLQVGVQNGVCCLLWASRQPHGGGGNWPCMCCSVQGGVSCTCGGTTGSPARVVLPVPECLGVPVVAATTAAVKQPMSQPLRCFFGCDMCRLLQRSFFCLRPVSRTPGGCSSWRLPCSSPCM
jgi:hypothetical protein